jgi:predicted RNA-binding Zn ribbon-like protein
LASALPNEWAPEPCLDLINTRFNDHLGSGKIHDRLPLPVWRRAFLKHWSYRVDDPDDASAVERLTSLRRMLRKALVDYSEGRALSAAARRQIESEINRAPFVVRIVNHHGSQGLSLQRAGNPWDVVTADIATSAMRLIGEQKRIKVCANPSCSWMFEDESRSGSRRWCDVSICGSLINVRRHRVRTSRVAPGADRSAGRTRA